MNLTPTHYIHNLYLLKKYNLFLINLTPSYFKINITIL